MGPQENPADARAAATRADWVAGFRSYALAWGAPTALLVAAIWMPHPAKTLIWGGALTWMGIACLINAAQCGRTHCWFTGPFFMVMAAASVAHGYQVLWFGPRGWLWLGIMIGAGSALLWVLSESVWGRYRPRRKG